MDERPNEPISVELIETIGRLEALVETLDAEIKKFARWMNDGDRLIIERIRMVERDLHDAFERVKNIEFKVFPELAGDILRVYHIIGEGEDKADNPLDHRKPDDNPTC